MQNLETQKTSISNATNFAAHLFSFLKPSSMLASKKPVKISRENLIDSSCKSEKKEKDVLFAEIKSLLDDF